METKTLVFTVLIGTFMLVDAEIQKLKNQYCMPRPTIVATDDPSFKHFPFFISLHRCAGSWDIHPPSHWRCVVKNSVDVDVRLLDVKTLSVEAGGNSSVKMKNHTSCTWECATKASDCKYWEKYDRRECRCVCPYKKAPVACGPKKFWNSFTCNCECIEKSDACPAKRSWSKDTCGCICDAKYAAVCAKVNKVLDPRTCFCRDAVKIRPAEKGREDPFTKQTFWYYVVIGEFVVLVVLFDTVLFFKKTGMIFALTKRCRGKDMNLSGACEETLAAYDHCCTCKKRDGTNLPVDKKGTGTGYLSPRGYSELALTNGRDEAENVPQCV